ncbi:helicase-related protein [Limnohabitans sp. Rim8]|uniref:helicase-related protein n=1 Tax=Limnohabitans sp. Rim8 TaxID=1100718 RepID=UPI0025CD921C|nr:helicase-related protein [Limnohabitans sp. Rim8]
MSSLDTNLANREQMLTRLRAEVVGPDPSGKPVSLVDKQTMTWEEYRIPRVQADGQEIVWQDPPTKRFGAGILFPLGATEETVVNATEGEESIPDNVPEAPLPGLLTDQVPSAWEHASSFGSTADDQEEEDVTLANAFRPSAIGVSFLADLASETAGISIELVNVGRVGLEKTIEQPCGVYAPLTIQLGGSIGKQSIARKVWLRKAVVDDHGKVPVIHLATADLLNARHPLRCLIGPAALGLELVVVSRTWHSAPSSMHRLLTISVANKKLANEAEFETQCLFQAGIRVSGQSSRQWIDPYPDSLVADFHSSDPMADENVNRVLYRENRTFAIGHGCGADWISGRPKRVDAVWSDVLPVFETPATSADLQIRGPEGRLQPLRVSMRLLAGLQPNDDGLADVDHLLKEYHDWIASLDSKVATIAELYRPTATELIDKCRQCADRIADGLSILRQSDSLGDVARKAFRLANQAMLVAQLRARQELRLPGHDTSGKLTWSRPVAELDPSVPNERQGYWRPFQIAFLLMSLRGICDPSHRDRTEVDLIWFPTGGGKTEAYLGLTAFTVFFNALTGVSNGGVDVLMRYTLRLLTAQQFQRAATLFCAMEQLRRGDALALGDRPFRIGLWVGSSATPNKRDDAVAKLQKLGRDPDAENPYVLLRCPWCAAKFGPHEDTPSAAQRGRGRGGRQAAGVQVYGYKRERGPSGDTVVFRCHDADCEFGGLAGPGNPPLPIVVIDEDLLDSPPNLLIGTVDKFAMLAWSPAARSIFGLDESGRHRGVPPTLIIQDELHLISGPLGSMVGAYETVIEALCIDPLGGMILPKIVASTATISRAREQIVGLYARSGVMLFPPSGLDAADSFFAREACDEQGRPKPGRLYAGVLAPAHTSLQTSEARVFATLMQHASLLEGDARDLDPWWTLLVFFNSLRELGGAATLFTADTREYLKVILNRHGLDYSRIRQLFHVEELTSRIRGDHIPRLLERLEVSVTVREGKGASVPSPAPIDACLASNIIEVGVDVPRLSLMAIVGQPKTTSQYIQVSSRVGRDLERPGMVVVIYGQTKPRDRSHYERFRSYHQRLYAQVEPTSVTPFSPPAVDRALHGLVVALVRQLGHRGREADTPDPFPLAPGTELRLRIEEIIRDRVKTVAPDEEMSVMDRLRLRLDQWKAWNPAEYGDFARSPEHPPLMHPAGRTELAQWDGRSWATMSSLRNVDASCEADLTMQYNNIPGGNP